MQSLSGHHSTSSSRRYQRHRPENTSLYPIVEQHLPTLRNEFLLHETSLPHFVVTEFQDYLRCGRLEYGFVRVKCNGCRHEHLVAFSCKRRGFCPSCGARRMIETSAHLVEHMFPEVPVRQWVLSFPWPLRLLFASRPDALGRCLAVIVRAIQTDLTHRAGLKASTGARTGVVTLIQRFGSALNLNVHLQMLILDGVYTLEQNGPRFHRVGAPDTQTLQRLLNRLVRRILRRLTRDEFLIEDPEQPWLDLEPTDTLDQLNAASIRYRIAAGHGAGGRTLTLKGKALNRLLFLSTLALLVSEGTWQSQAAVSLEVSLAMRRFTKSDADSLRPSDRPREVMDPAHPGFGIKIHPTGRKSWLYRFRTPEGRLRRISLGAYADGHGVSLAEARERYFEERRVRQRCGDPLQARLEARRAAREEAERAKKRWTVKQLIAHHIRESRKGVNPKRTWDQDKEILDRDVARQLVRSSR